MKALFEKELKENLLKFIIESILLIGIAISLIPYGYRLMENINPEILNIGGIGTSLSAILPKLKNLDFFVYSQWFGKNLFEMAILFAVINSAGIIAGETERKTAIFLFSRPISRNRTLSVKLAVTLFYTLLPIIISTYILLPLSKSIPQQINTSLLNKLLIQSLVATSVIVFLTSVLSIVIDDRVKVGLASLGIVIGSIILGYIKGMGWFSIISLYMGKFNTFVTVGLVLCAALALTAFKLLSQKEF
jgi:ABC-2 type transport system permease protein